MKTYRTVGEVRADVDATIHPYGLCTSQGTFYPYIQGIVFGLINSEGRRTGDALCPLPRGGWLSRSYSPDSQEEPSDPMDQLRLKVLKGAGRLALPFVGVSSINRTTDLYLNPRPRSIGLPYQIINPEDELLIIHAQSTQYPENGTDLDPPNTSSTDDRQILASDIIYGYDVFNRPGGSADIRPQS